MTNNIIFEHHVHYHGILQIDSNRIRRVLLNLAANAKDAMVGTKTKEPKFRLIIKNINPIKYLIINSYLSLLDFSSERISLDSSLTKSSSSSIVSYTVSMSS